MLSGYDAIAEWYEESVRNGLPGHALATEALLALIEDVTGQQVCDLACGTGVAARELARRGAAVTGIDLSPRMLEIARRLEEQKPLGIRYLRDDAQALDEIADATFDGVACNLALMDIPDLNAALKTVARVLRPGGWFAFSLTHPCFHPPEARWTGRAGGTVKREVRGYFNEGFWRSDNVYGVRGKVGAHHRTLSTYVNELYEAGLNLEQLAEPQAQDAMMGRVPGYHEVPAILAARCRRKK
jgi:ubiquinone/menaquinone biosynthesis C-methylase UbiE